MNNQFKHLDLLAAISKGGDIEILLDSRWVCLPVNILLRHMASRTQENIIWRIAAKIKRDIVRGMTVSVDNSLDDAYAPCNLEITFDGETMKLKSAKVLKVDSVPQ